MTTILLIDLTILGMITLLGIMLVFIIRGRSNLLEFGSLSFPIGAGTLTLILFLSSWLGVPYTKTSLIGILVGFFAALSCGVILVRSKSGRNTAKTNVVCAPKPALGLRVLFYAALVLCFLVVAYLSVARSYSTWDAIGIWGIKGYGIAKEGTIFAGERWGSHGLTYPLNLPLQISVFRLLDSDVLPGSKLIFYHFWKRYIEWKFAAMGALLLASIPIIFEHGTIGYANLPFTTYLVLGLLYVLDGIAKEDTRGQIIGGLLLGLATWTRPEGVFLVIFSLGAVLIGSRALRFGEIRLFAVLSPVVLIAGIWQGFTLSIGSQGLVGSALQSAWGSWSRLELHPGALYWTVRYMARQSLEIKIWGVLVPMIVLILAANFRKLKPKEYPLPFLLLIAGAMVGGTVALYYYLASFVSDVIYLLGTSVNRLFMPMWVLAILWSVVLAGETGEFPSLAEKGMGA